MREIISIAIMLLATGCIIAWLDFIQRNIPDALEAKEKASAGLSGGTGEGSDTGLDTHSHSGTPLVASPPETGL